MTGKGKGARMQGMEREREKNRQHFPHGFFSTRREGLAKKGDEDSVLDAGRWERSRPRVTEERKEGKRAGIFASTGDMS